MKMDAIGKPKSEDGKKKKKRGKKVLTE